MAYNLTNVSSAGNIFEITKSINVLTGNLWANMILFIVFIVIFIFSARENMKTRFLISSFVLSFVAVLFHFLQLTNIQSLILPIIMLLISLFVKIFVDA